MTFRISTNPTIDVKPGNRRKAIGSKAGALAAVRGRLMPLGNGCYKQAYHSPLEDVVYKVSISDVETLTEPDSPYAPEEPEGWAIDNEFREANRLRTEGHRWAAPTSVYIIDGVYVGAQPFYPGTYDDMGLRPKSPKAKAQLRQADNLVGDMHSDNYRFTRNGQVRVIDLGQ